MRRSIVVHAGLVTAEGCDFLNLEIHFRGATISRGVR
jgi:hypothetical protein